MPGFAKTSTERYTLTGAALLRQQQQQLDLYRERLLTIREVALALGVTVPTVRKFTRNGVLPRIRYGVRGWMKIPASAVRDLLQKGVTTNV